MGHTKEPWVNINNIIESHTNGKMDEEYIEYLEDFSEQDARRIVACVNACQGIDTENLEMIGRMFAEKKLASTPLNIIDKVESENKRMREALEPSAETKAAYIGEFSIPVHLTDDDGCGIVFQANIPWTTIKEIMAAIKARAALGKE
jgi:hypothetical protein